jgi:hypothetical protein
MSSSPSLDSSASKASSTSETTDTQGPVECRICGKQFDDMAEMQRHTLTEHIQKGDLPNEDH